MNSNKPKKKKRFKVSDEELFGYILGSFELLEQYIKDVPFDQLENDILLQDAVNYRIQMIGVAAHDLSEEIMEKYKEFPWSFYLIWELPPDYCGMPQYEEIWELLNSAEQNKDDFDSIRGLFYQLEQIYLKEFHPEKIKKLENRNEKPLDTDYPYSLKTKNSIWTVKNKHKKR